VTPGRPARDGLRTWDHPAPAAVPPGVYRLGCGCWRDGYSDRMWEPCMAHEGEGHLAVISTDQDGGVSVARCLVHECRWRTEQGREAWAVAAAREHWEATRS
jgi:hypothetical protein